MATVTINDTHLTNIAAAIREKNGTTNTYKPSEMPAAIAAIQGGGEGSSTGLLNYLAGSTTVLSDDTVTKIGNYRFASYAVADRVITALDLPSATIIGKYAFYTQSKMTSINLPKVQELQEAALMYCFNNITEIVLPEVLTVGKYALFSNDTSTNATVLEKIDLGKVTSIAAQAIGYHENLTAVIIRTDSVCTLANTNVFTSIRPYIYVPAALVDSYKSATNWSTYASYIRAIEDYPEICGEVA